LKVTFKEKVLNLNLQHQIKLLSLPSVSHHKTEQNEHHELKASKVLRW
jgi:hypothetical protein